MAKQFNTLLTFLKEKLLYIFCHIMNGFMGIIIFCIVLQLLMLLIISHLKHLAGHKDRTTEKIIDI